MSGKRLFTALALAGGAALFLSSGAMAASGAHRSGQGSPTPPATFTQGPTGCDVPGASCDPSKTDQDNGVGNSCDPGYGQGNQDRPGAEVDPTTTCGMTSSSSRGQAAAKQQSGAMGGETQGSQTEGTETQGTEAQGTKPSAPHSLATACAQENARAHSDNESTSGADHESTAAMMHDSGARVSGESLGCAVSASERSEAGETMELNSGLAAQLEKLFVSESGQAFTMTLVLSNQQTLTINFVPGTPPTVTINGQVVPAETMETIIAGVMAQLEQGGTLALGSGSAHLTVTPLPNGGFTVTLPNGTVLTISSGTVASGTTTIPSGATGEVGGVSVTNGAAPTGTTAAATTTTGGASASGGASGAASAGVLGAAAQAVTGAASAAQGAPLAATGLPLLGGIVGFLMIAAGLVARRRS